MPKKNDINDTKFRENEDSKNDEKNKALTDEQLSDVSGGLNPPRVPNNDYDDPIINKV